MLAETSDAGVWIWMLGQVGWSQMSKGRLKNWKKNWWRMMKSYVALENASQNCRCRYSVGSVHKYADPNVDTKSPIDPYINPVSIKCSSLSTDSALLVPMSYPEHKP